MICIGIPDEILNKVPMYDGMFHVFTDLRGFYENAYDASAHVFVITDAFINMFFQLGDLPEVIAEIKRIRPELDIVLLGKNCSYEIAGTYLIHDTWDLPTHTSSLMAKLHQREKSLSTNRNEQLYRDFMLHVKKSTDMVMYLLSNPGESMRFLGYVLNYIKRKFSSETPMINDESNDNSMHQMSFGKPNTLSY